MSIQTDTIAAVATPRRAWGHRHSEAVRPPGGGHRRRGVPPPGEEGAAGAPGAHPGVWGPAGPEGQVIDRVLCTYSRGPESYTGEDTAELHCHGSPMVLTLGLEALFAPGGPARPDRGSSPSGPSLNGRLDLAQAEAVADLLDAQSREGARHAAGQLSGALSRRVGEIYSALVDLMAHFHAVLDYPDEDIDPFTQEQLSRDLTRQEGALERLLATYRRGRQLSRGVRCAIVGRPNAGKSSLLNALVGYERAIVTDIPGTTRDTVEENVELGGRSPAAHRHRRPAGQRRPHRAAGGGAQPAAMEEAELILLVVDAAAEVTAEDADLARAVAESGKPWIFCGRQTDLVEQSTSVGLIGAEVRAAARTVELSSKTGEGLDSLAQAVAELFPRDAGSGYGELLTNARQAQAAQRALEAVKRGPGGPGAGGHPRRPAHRRGGGPLRPGGADGPVGAGGRDRPDFPAVLRGKVTLKPQVVCQNSPVGLCWRQEVRLWTLKRRGR